MSDEEVVGLACGGVTEAFETMVARYRPLVEHRARTYFLVGADHEDVVQEGFLGLVKAIRDYRVDRTTRFKPFAELCVTRQIITAVKTATRQKHSALNGSVSLDGSLGEGSSSSLLDLIADRNADVEANILEEPPAWADSVNSIVQESLSPLERAVLQSYLSGLTYREMSQELDCHTKCIDNAMQRVKRKIGTALREHIED